MKKFLRENPTIAFGLGLPLLLVVAFLLISGIPTLFVSPPQHDVLYSTGYYNHQNDVQISVVNKKVQVIYQSTAQRNQKPRIWRYNPKTGAVQEVAFLLPPGLILPNNKQSTSEIVSKTTVIDVPDLEGVTVDSSSIAPDGYEFSVGNRYSRNVFGGLFYSSRYRNEAVLIKSGRSVRLPNASGQNYYSRNTRFIGWVVSP